MKWECRAVSKILNDISPSRQKMILFIMKGRWAHGFGVQAAFDL